MFLTEKKEVRISNILSDKLDKDKCHDDDTMDYQKVLQSLETGCLYLNTSSDESQPEIVGKKRMRLHQLSWEEKIQRKKMRNRIAAQTSRDRKKAKMDCLEESVKELKNQNQELFSEINELKKQNELLIDANEELQKLLSMRTLTCTCQKKNTETRRNDEAMETTENVISQIQTCVGDDLPLDGPAEGSVANLGTVPDRDYFMDSLENLNSLPPFPEMLADVEGEEFLDDLERLAASLLKEVEQDDNRGVVENVADKNSRSCQQQCNIPNEMVGQTSEIMETFRVGGSDNINNSKCQDLTLFASTNEKLVHISLEHSYAQSNTDFKMEEFLEIKPKEQKVDNHPSIKITEAPAEKPLTFQEAVATELLPKMDYLDISSFSDYSSPVSDSSSDLGYESLDSPYGSDLSNNDNLNELWNDSFSELFPELL